MTNTCSIRIWGLTWHAEQAGTSFVVVVAHIALDVSQVEKIRKDLEQQWQK